MIVKTSIIENLSKDLDIKLPFWVNGFSITFFAIILLEFFSQIISIHNPAAILQSFVVMAAFIGGVRSGLRSAVLVLIYLLYYLSIPGELFFYTRDGYLEVVTILITTPLIAVLAGILKHRSQLLTFEEAERMKAEAIAHTAEKSEKQYRTLFERNPMPMWISDIKTLKFLAVNEAMVKSYGYSRKEFLNMTTKDIRPKEEFEKMARFFSKIEESSKTGLNYAGTWIHKKKDGSLINTQSFWTYIYFKGHTAMLVLTEDITERLELERRKDEFISIASHEFKTPITTIKGYSELLVKRLKDSTDKNVIEYLGRTNEQIDRLTELVNDLLDVSKIQAGKIDLNLGGLEMGQFVGENVKEIQSIVRSHKIFFKYKKNIPLMVVGDKHRLGQVLNNLILNAVKYSPNADRVVVRCINQQEYVRVEVKDFGPGISREHAKKVFDRFFRIDNTQGNGRITGLGLGLYIASEIIKKHKGEIGVESEVGKGSVFYFTLPKMIEE